MACKAGPAYWHGWDPYLVPDRYDDYQYEYGAVREAAGAIDMSALWKVEISGREATDFLNYALPRDVSSMAAGQIFWSPLCSERGRVVGDGPLVRLEEQKYWFSSMPMDSWFRWLADRFDVEIVDITDQYGILSLQGPRSAEILATATDTDWSD